jgi:hypothetical protein
VVADGERKAHGLGVVTEDEERAKETEEGELSCCLFMERETHQPQIKN